MISPPNSRNILSRLYNALVDGINRYNQLPRIIVIILDDDFTKMTSNYDNTEELFGWIIGQICLLMYSRKNEMISFASRPDEPKLLMVKPLPRSESQDTKGNNPYRNLRRVFNRSVDNIISRYDETYVVNMDEIRPESFDLFDISGNKLNLKGIQKFWSGINRAVQRLDRGRMRLFKMVFREMQMKPRKYRSLNNKH